MNKNDKKRLNALFRIDSLREGRKGREEYKR
jgi:hypothetical protein